MKKIIKNLKNRVCDWLDCKRGKCSYYKHYLAYGPDELTHRGFHSAEKRCTYWQMKHESKYENDSSDGELRQLEEICRYWEKIVRA